jgi:teichuronic acid biosynthesis glycosyltransferase TuaC
VTILFITGSYPSVAAPAANVFVQQFVWAVSRLRHQCAVVAPVSLFARRFGPLPPEDSVESAGGGNVQVVRPRVLTSTTRKIRGVSFANAGQTTFDRAVSRAARRLPVRPDLVYGHFLYQAGAAAVSVGHVLGIPSIVGVGEDHFWTVESMGYPRARRDFQRASGFLAVSQLNRERLVADLGIPPERIRVFHNGVDLCRFHPRNRSEMCRKYGVPVDTFNVAFVGSLEERKGPNRLVSAVQGLHRVRLLLIGAGPMKIEAENIVIKRQLTQPEVAECLSAADVFVLPTTSEGSCNALIEAMATGLPIVTSIGRHNDDIVDNDVAIRINPMDIRAIREAIVALMNDPARRERMSEACLEKSSQFDINLRAKKVTLWMEELARGHRR